MTNSQAKSKLRIPNPRSPQFYTVDDGDFHRLQLALAMLAEDETPSEVNRIIRDACYDAADADDLARVERISAITKGQRAGSVIGPKLGCEILAALGRFLQDHENGKETP